MGEAVLVRWEKDLLRSSFTRAHTNLMQRADVPQPLFTPRNEKKAMGRDLDSLLSDFIVEL